MAYPFSRHSKLKPKDFGSITPLCLKHYCVTNKYVLIKDVQVKLQSCFQCFSFYI